MRLCVVVMRERESAIYCGECQFQNKGYDFCELFKQATPCDTTREPMRINECFTAQRRGEDPTWRDDGLEPLRSRG